MKLSKFFPLWAPEDGAGASEPAPASASAPASPEGSPVTGETSVPGDSSEGLSFDGLGGFDEIEILDEAATPSTPRPVNGPTTDASSTPSTESAIPSASPSSPTPATTPAPVPSAPQAAPTPPAAPTQPAPAPTAAATPPAPADAQAAPPAASPPMDVGSLMQQLSENKAQLLETLASDARFQLSQEEATLMETDPARAVPRISARILYEATNMTLSHINNFVPQMIARYVAMSELQRKNESDFYSKFNVLDPQKHGADVHTFGRIFKQSHPNLSKENFFAMIAAAVMAKHGLTMVTPPAAPNGATPQPTAPVAPPFAPAAPGAAPSASVRTHIVEEHPFAGLGQDWEN